MLTVKQVLDAFALQGTEKITIHALGYEGPQSIFSVTDEQLKPYYDYSVSHFASAGRYGEKELNTVAIGNIVYFAPGISDKWMVN